MLKNKEWRKACVLSGLIAALGMPLIVADSGTALAQAVVTTRQYQIGAGSVTGATAAAQPATTGATATYTVKFTTPTALSKGQGLTITDPTGATTFPTSVSKYSIVDNSSSSGNQSPSSVVLASGDHTVTLDLAAPIVASSSLTVSVSGVTNPAKAGTYSLELSTSASPGPATTPSYQISAPTPAPPFSATATPATVSALSTYTVGPLKAAAAVPAGGLVQISDSATSGASDNVGLPSAASAYKVDNLSTGASTPPSAVTIAGTGSSATGETVDLKLSAPVASADQLSITISGARSPSTNQTDAIAASAPSSAPASTANLVIGTSVTAPSIALSQSAAGATGVQYTIGLKLTSALPAGGTITLVAPAGTSFSGTSVTLVGTTRNSSSAKLAASSVKATAASGSATDNEVSISVPNALSAGDNITLEIAGVGNPPAGSYGGTAGDFTIATSTDLVPATVAAYVISVPPAPAMPSISVSPTTPGATAAYVISGLRTTSPLVAGSSTIALTGPAGTVFPSSTVDYTITNASNGQGTGHVAAVSGGGTNAATLRVGTSVASGDLVDIVIEDVANPGGGTYQMSLVGDLAAVSTPTAAPTPAPSAPSSTRTSLAASPNPALVGGRVVLTASVTPAVTAGTVSFSYNGKVLSDCGNVAIRAGTATCTASGVTLGTGMLQASYSGASGYGSSLSSLVSLDVTNAAHLALSGAPATAAIGQRVTYMATLVPAANRGTVRFTSDGTALAGCAAVPATNGHATCTVSFWTGGPRSITADYTPPSGVLPTVPAVLEQAVSYPPAGYWLATRAGAVYGFGGAKSLGGMSISTSSGPVVSIANTPTGKGYWLVTARGAVFAFGDAKSYGDLPAMKVKVSDVVAIAPTYDGHGYWLVARDGGIFAFGDAKYHGSVPALHKHVANVVGMVSAPGGGGYIEVGSDGGVFSFGTARFHGSLPGLGKHVNDIRAIIQTSTNSGYVLVGSDGGAFIFGQGVHFLGSLPGKGIKVHDIVGLALTANDAGYYMAGSDGKVYAFGNGTVYSAPAVSHPPSGVVAIAGT